MLMNLLRMENIVDFACATGDCSNLMMLVNDFAVDVPGFFAKLTSVVPASLVHSSPYDFVVVAAHLTYSPAT